MTTYHDEKRLLDFLVQRLEDRLAGRHESEFLRTHPSDHCQLGVLAPWTSEPDLEEQPDEELLDEDVRADQQDRTPNRAPVLVPDDHDPDEPARAPPLEPFSTREDAARRPPSSIGLAFALAPEISPIKLVVHARCTVYSRHFPDYASQRLELGSRDPSLPGPGGRTHVSLLDKFRRHTLNLPLVEILLDSATPTHLEIDSIQSVFDDLTAQLRQDPMTLRQFVGHRIVPLSALRSEADYHAYLRTLSGTVEIPRWRATFRVRAQPTANGLRIEVRLCNKSNRDLLRPSNDQFCTLYDAEIDVAIESGKLIPIELTPVPQDYQYDRSVYALGRNAGSQVSADYRHLRTKALARYEQERMTTADSVIAAYCDLAENPIPVLERIHSAMLAYSDDWSNRVIGQNALNLNPAELKSCREDLAAFEREIDTFRAGVAALNKDPRLLLAFRSMNRAFAPPRGRFPAWRLFQIVFVVTQLPALVIRENITGGEWPPGVVHDWTEVLERADVLWFPTGGGKTEAYLGLVGCAALYDRLRGKQMGVTAWLRFPLRMLSVQQLQRAMRTVWNIELQRRELELERGALGDSISLGYFVGSNNTPNTFFGQWTFERLEADNRQRERLLLIPDCPVCETEGSVEIKLDRPNERVLHVCTSCHAELPVYVSDSEIYRFQPTLLVGTIDKIAAIGYQSRVASIWRGPDARCPCTGHGYVVGEWCVYGCSTNSNARAKTRPIPVVTYDTSPALHIQDELHLLQEELGAFAGHYETMVRANESAASGRPAKVIAATATISGFVHQSRHIYGVREVRRFPNRGYDLHQTFYTQLERQTAATDAPPKVARLFAAFRPPFLRPADAAARCAEILHEAINELQADLHRTKRLLGLPESRRPEEIRALLAFYSRTLTYVGKRDSGVRIRQRLEQSGSREDSALRPGGARDLNIDYLSAHSTLKEIAATIKKAESPTPWSAADHLDATVATHVISHGVDVEYYNLMFLERIPEQVADYIQVASRSGRQHVGLVLAVLPRYSLRAGSIYDRFTEFHRHLDRMVLPVPVNRFAKAAAERSFPGILLGSLYGRFNGLLRGTKQSQLRLVGRGMSGGLSHLTRASLREALQQSFALGDGRFDESLERQMNASIEHAWERFLWEVKNPSHADLTAVFDPKPMSSLRDVDVAVPFRPDDNNFTYHDLLWFEQPHAP